MYSRRRYVREAATMTRNSTYKVDLPNDGKLSGLLLRCSVAGVSGAFATVDKYRIVDYLKKIEVIGNGSIPIKSYSGQCCAGAAWYDQGITNLDYWHTYATGTKWYHGLINFGRKLFDPHVYLDLAKWDNVELSIENDGTSTFFGEDFSMSILGIYLEGDDVPPEKGYMRSEEWKSWTTVADATEYLDLPSEYRLRRIMMQLWPDQDANMCSETGMWNMADDIELMLQSGAKRIWKGGVDDLMWENAWHYGREVLSTTHMYKTADYGVRIGMGYCLGGGFGPGTQDGAVAGTIATMEGRCTNNTQKAETYEADTLIEGIWRGLCPENCVVFPFDQNNEPETWLDLAREKTVELNIHTRNQASAADGTNKVILDRLVPA